MSQPSEPRKPFGFSDGQISWALFAGSFLALLATEKAVGFVRDESVYFAAAESYAGWFRLLFQSPSVALTDAAIVRAFDFNHEHPALMKALYGLSHLLFHQTLGWLRPAAAFRLPAFAIASTIPPLLYRFGFQVYGRQAGLFAALSFFLVPRQFFNAQLACFDMPVAALWLLTVVTFFASQTRPRYWLYTGLSFGLALATKHNALFLPFVLVPFSLWRAFRIAGAKEASRALLAQFLGLYVAIGILYGLLFVALGPEAFLKGFVFPSPHVALFGCLVAGSAVVLWRLRARDVDLYRALAPLAAMAILGPAVFYLHWPYLWHHPVDRTAWYLAFHATHSHYAWFYLGTLLRQPPFPLEYVFVKTALTVPASLLVPMVLGLSTLLWGAVRLARRPSGSREWPRWVDLLVGANALASILIISHPNVPHFGGVKHWFPSMPFLGLLAGTSVARVQVLLNERLGAAKNGLLSRAAAAVLWGLLLLPALIGLVRVHPYGTSYYSELAGGVPGAASLGMQRQFWSNNVTGVLPWINEHAPRNARIYLHEVNGFSFRDYQRNGMLREDLQPAGGPQDAALVAYQYHQEFREHEFNTWQAFGTTKPVFGLYLDETPQVVVYARR